MMKLLAFSCLFLAVIHVSTAGGGGSSKDVNEMCGKNTCSSEEVCRVVEKCGRKRKSVVKCIKCIPKDADKVCNLYGYQRAVLSGPNRNLAPLSCHVHGVPNRFSCPLGSKCKGDPKTPGLGHCCYDKDDDNMGPFTNDDTVCSACKYECKNGKTCQADVDCGKLTYDCRPEVKGGICPIYSQPTACNDDDRERKCEYDEDCNGSLKCCITACGGTSCRAGYVFSG